MDKFQFYASNLKFLSETFFSEAEWWFSNRSVLECKRAFSFLENVLIDNVLATMQELTIEFIGSTDLNFVPVGSGKAIKWS